MGQRVSVDQRGSALATNQALALGWLDDFQSSEDAERLDEAARGELGFAVRVLARCFTQRWSSATWTPYSLDDMTADDAIDVLTGQLPHTASAVHPDALIDALVTFLVWAAKHGRIHDRGVEYACRKIQKDARAAMAEERKWSPGKLMVTKAMADGIDPSDMVRVREHALRIGFDVQFVDEFLPPPPVSLGSGRYLFLGDEPAGYE